MDATAGAVESTGDDEGFREENGRSVDGEQTEMKSGLTWGDASQLLYPRVSPAAKRSSSWCGA